MTVTGTTSVDQSGGSRGVIHFDGGTLETGSLAAGAMELTGTGTIRTRGIVADTAVVFDSADDLLLQSFRYNSQPEQDITIHLSGSNDSDTLGAGYSGTGSLTIRNDVDLSSRYGYIGYKSGATGVVSVEGPGSSWTNSTSLFHVGHSGDGTLSISGGGAVTSYHGYVGYGAGSTGVVTVAGTDSSWTVKQSLHVGNEGVGTLLVTGGGTVTSSSASFVGHESGSAGEVTVEGTDSSWTVKQSLYVGNDGTGTLNITGGGLVTVTKNTTVTEGRGEIHFEGGILETQSLLARTEELTGTGTVRTHGIVADADLVFDSPDDLVLQSLACNSQPNQDITIHLTTDGQGILGAGYSSTGSLAIRNGVDVSSTYGYIGYGTGVSGAVTVEGTGSSWTSGELYIGKGGSGTLSITGGGAVSSSAGFIGSTSEVTVEGTGSFWKSGYLSVGSGGGGTLSITGGAKVDSSYGYIGYSSNSMGGATVEGIGSTWTTGSDLIVGHKGTGTLSITSGGKVVAKSGHIGQDSGTGEVTVDGADSTWANSDDLCIGECGTGMLTIARGGDVDSDSGYIGRRSDSTGEVIVDGDGSTWKNRDDLYVGHSGSGVMSLTGGSKVSSRTGYVGCESGSTGEVTIDGTGSTWTNSDDLYVGCSSTGTLSIVNGGIVKVQGDTHVGFGDADQGTVRFDGGTLETGLLWTAESRLTGIGTIVVHGIIADRDLVFEDPGNPTTQSFTLNNRPEQNIMVNLNLGSQAALGAGCYATGSLAVRNGVSTSSLYGCIGCYSGASGEVTVEGAGSTWANSENLYVGSCGSGTLSIAGGGTVNDNCAYIGYESDSIGEVTVTGNASTWTNRDDLCVGNSGSATLLIAGGGMVNSNRGYVGYASDSTGEVTVSGVDSIWTNSSSLYVGNSGGGKLSITGGGEVTSRYGYIGCNSGSTGEVMVDGAGSTWTNSASVYVGYSGSGTLSITDGGKVTGSGSIGVQPGATGKVTVSGVGSTWTGGSYVGEQGTGTLSITDGGTVYGVSSIGRDAGSRGEVTVDGADLTCHINNDFFVGRYGTGTLSITGGGKVTSANGWKGSFIGWASGSTGKVVVGGAGSSWTNESDLFVGHDGSGTLDILCGGTVNTNLRSYIGYESGSTGEVKVDGADSTWNNPRELYVGYSGSGTLSITDGGKVSSGASWIGYRSTGEVTVDGVGSIWSNEWLALNRGTLLITGGGRVNSAFNVALSGAATVEGIGSTWTSGGTFTVGGNSNGMLNIVDGGLVTVAGDMHVDPYNQDKGGVHLDGGTLETGSLWAGVKELTGAGTVHANGIIADASLVFDSLDDLPLQSFTYNSQPEQNITIHLTTGDAGILGAGYSGTGSLTIRNGVALSSTCGYIGYKSDSIGAVSVLGTSSSWTSSDDLYVGEEGNGTLAIAGGGEVSSQAGYVGHDSGSTGTVVVDGAGSSWTNSDNLYVGDEGNGTLLITGGGRVGNTSGYLGYEPDSIGEVAVKGTGSVWTSSSALFVGYEGTGRLSIADGGRVNSKFAFIGNLSGSIGDVTVSGIGSTWANAGNLRVRHLLSITDGGLVSVDGILTIPLKLEGDSLVNMATGGMLALWGDADDSLGAFFDLIDGTDAIRYWDSGISDWANLTGATPGEDYTLGYLAEGDLAGYTLLTVGTVPPPGDANGDGVVDALDAAVLAKNWLAEVTEGAAEGDLNEDGRVDDLDASILAAHWQYTPGAAAVPEPSGVLLLVAGALLLVGWRGFVDARGPHP